MGREYTLRGREAMLKLFRGLKGDDDYGLSEDEINELGLRLLYERKDAGAAIEVLKLNAVQFPRSFNVWDSLGEAYYQMGNREEAIRNYERSLQLNPDNIGGKRMLERIRNEKEKQ
jgi:tetratricopeptide (TPR) repeat protein